MERTLDSKSKEKPQSLVFSCDNERLIKNRHGEHNNICGECGCEAVNVRRILGSFQNTVEFGAPSAFVLWEA